MPIVVDGQTYYKTAEVCQLAGISRSTLFRWLKQDPKMDARHRDKRGWRLFTEQEAQTLKRESTQLTQVGD